MMDKSPTIWDVRRTGETPRPTLAVMSTTWLTKRRAVDHCRVRSSLCRMSV